jgi:hypothetical protein
MAKFRSIDLEVQPSASLIEPFITYRKTTRNKLSFSCYELSTGFEQVDGLYGTASEAMKAVISESLLLKLKELL